MRSLRIAEYRWTQGHPDGVYPFFWLGFVRGVYLDLGTVPQAGYKTIRM
jgi:hypothetical protein